MLEVPVKLIVKAPNQQVEDQTIHCSLSWTIKKLKGHLSKVHPSKPNTEDQRLIYYGQLLNDSVTLKDVFTKYEAGEETHTVHLVCMPSKETLKMQARKLAEEKSRRAKEASSNGASSSSTSSTSSSSTSTSSLPQRPDANQNENENITEANAEYSNSVERNYTQSLYQNWMAGFQSQDPATNYMQQWTLMHQIYANYYMAQYQNMFSRPHTVIRVGGGARQEAEARNNAAQRRRVEDEDNHIHRDWLDCLYTMSRFVVLLSIVYFYSSPLRFIIVSTLGMALYLYQVGFFRLNQFIDDNDAVNFNNNNNNNNIPFDNNNVIPPGEMAGAPGREIEEEFPPLQPELNPQPNLDGNPNGDQPDEALDNPSFITRTWIFVTTFFSSMIPEAENPI